MHTTAIAVGWVVVYCFRSRLACVCQSTEQQNKGTCLVPAQAHTSPIAVCQAPERVSHATRTPDRNRRARGPPTAPCSGGRGARTPAPARRAHRAADAPGACATAAAGSSSSSTFGPARPATLEPLKSGRGPCATPWVLQSRGWFTQHFQAPPGPPSRAIAFAAVLVVVLIRHRPSRAKPSVVVFCRISCNACT